MDNICRIWRCGNSGYEVGYLVGYDATLMLNDIAVTFRFEKHTNNTRVEAG
jgi:hypothetical protein